MSSTHTSMVTTRCFARAHINIPLVPVAVSYQLRVVTMNLTLIIIHISTK